MDRAGSNVGAQLSPPVPDSRPPANAHWEAHYTTTVTLAGGQEWVSDPLQFEAGETVCLRCDSPVRFYAGLFDQEAYAAARRRNATVFPFQRGTDATAYEEARDVSTRATFRVVLRIGIFAPRGAIRATVWKSVLTAPPPPASTLAEDVRAREVAARRARVAFGSLVVVVVAIGGLLLWYDFGVITLNNRTQFFDALSAEATAVFAVGFVAGGLYGVWKLLGFPHRREGTRR